VPASKPARQSAPAAVLTQQMRSASVPAVAVKSSSSPISTRTDGGSNQSKTSEVAEAPGCLNAPTSVGTLQLPSTASATTSDSQRRSGTAVISTVSASAANDEHQPSIDGAVTSGKLENGGSSSASSATLEKIGSGAKLEKGASSSAISAILEKSGSGVKPKRKNSFQFWEEQAAEAARIKAELAARDKVLKKSDKPVDEHISRESYARMVHSANQV
jgi:hypothetical protein